MSRRLNCIFIITLFTLMGCGLSPQTIPGPSTQNIYPEGRKLSNLERRAYTNKFLTKIGFPLDTNTYLLPGFPYAHFRDQKEIARRAVVLYALIHVSFHRKPVETIKVYLEKYHLWDDLSTKEQRYLSKAERTDQEDTVISWEVESLNVLLWTLGHFKTLPYPSVVCDITQYPNLPDLDADPAEWIANARIRSQEDVLNETDLVLRLENALVKTYVDKTLDKRQLNFSVLNERRLTLTWLLMKRKSWDKITEGLGGFFSEDD